MALHTGLRQAYADGYTTERAAVVALTAPTVILLLLVAIAGVGIDFFPDAAPDIGLDVAPEPVPGPTVEGPPAAPDLVAVDGYVRSNPDGIVENNLSYDGPRPPDTPEAPGYHTVRPHVRTAPDGILENNLSYEGPPPESANTALRPSLEVPRPPAVELGPVVESVPPTVVEPATPPLQPVVGAAGAQLLDEPLDVAVGRAVQRVSEAEGRLKWPNVDRWSHIQAAEAHATLGILRFRQGDTVAASVHLTRARALFAGAERNAAAAVLGALIRGL
ncbi:MAG: hypothetical protein AAF211_01530 [Myxococcota bacterium]